MESPNRLSCIWIHEVNGDFMPFKKSVINKVNEKQAA